jgi:HEPN domain-containing protein
MNIEKQINYWHDGAVSNIDTAKLLIDNGKLIEGLFFAHLSIEKILKAHYVKANKELAPKTHNLNYLSEKSLLQFSEEQKELIAVLMEFQLEGRYPEHYPEKPSQVEAQEYFLKTTELLQWLKTKL